jgi:site-specific DNA-cytosine methylase
MQVGQLYGTDIEPNPQAGRIYSPDGISPTMDTCQGGNRMPKIAVECFDFSQSGREGSPRIYNDICPTLGARDYKEPRCVKIISLGNITPSGNGMNGNVFSSDGLDPCISTNKGEGSKIAIPVLTPDRPEKRQNGRRFKEDGDVMFTLTAQDKHGIAILDDTKSKRFGGGAISDICPTLRSSRHGHKVINTEDVNFRIRKLTPLECFRLQGFPDELFYKAKAVNSDSQLYKQAGNSVTVNVIYEIAKKF